MGATNDVLTIMQATSNGVEAKFPGKRGFGGIRISRRKRSILQRAHRSPARRLHAANLSEQKKQPRRARWPAFPPGRRARAIPRQRTTCGLKSSLRLAIQSQMKEEWLP